MSDAIVCADLTAARAVAAEVDTALALPRHATAGDRVGGGRHYQCACPPRGPWAPDCPLVTRTWVDPVPHPTRAEYAYPVDARARAVLSPLRVSQVVVQDATWTAEASAEVAR